MPRQPPLPLELTALRRQHPFQVAFMLAAFVVGVLLVASESRPRSVAASMPGLVQAGWEIMLVVGGGIGLTAAWWRGHAATAIAVELGSLIVLAAALTMYTVAIVAVAGMAAVASATFIGAFGVASWWRAAQIARSVRVHSRRRTRQP